MKTTVVGIASATVANQPSFDAGGFPIQVLKTVKGSNKPWETLFDKVTLSLTPKVGKNAIVQVENEVLEQDAKPLPTTVSENTASRVILEAIALYQSNNGEFLYDVTVHVEKGISTKGTGLGSSGASPASALIAFEKALKYQFDDIHRCRLLANADFGVPDNSIPSFFGGLTQIHPTKNGFEHSQIKKGASFGKWVLATPLGFGISTQKAREVLTGKQEPSENKKNIQKMIEVFQKGDVVTYGEYMEKTHQWFLHPRIPLYPQHGAVYRSVYESAKKENSLGVTISGAGPTILSLVHNVEHGERVAIAMYNAFKERGFQSDVRVCDIDTVGAKTV